MVKKALFFSFIIIILYFQTLKLVFLKHSFARTHAHKLDRWENHCVVDLNKRLNLS
jgi:hypothetical protein